MNIHEYQGKQLLAGYGLPVADGVLIHDADLASSLISQLAGPLYVVKSQIHAGGRGKGHFRESPHTGGGVRLARSCEKAVAHVHEMLGKTLVTEQTGPEGKKVYLVYVEDGADIEREIYLSLLVDAASGKPCFVVSTEGGMDIEKIAQEFPSKIHYLPVDIMAGLADCDIARLNSWLRLEGQAAEEAAKIFLALYGVFIEKDMSLLEVNPLIVMKNGHLRLLDVKISFDDNALFRHPDIKALRDILQEDPKETEASAHGLSYVALEGNIGCMVNGAGLAMATMDIIKLHGGKSANFLDIGGSASEETVVAAFRIIAADASVKGILVNIFGGIMQCDIIAAGIVEAVRQAGLSVPLVVRLQGTNVDAGRRIFSDSGLAILFADNLDDAARKIIDAVEKAV